MTATDILQKLESLGSDQTKRILMNHGAKEPLFGVKIEDMKKLLKPVMGDNALALELFATGNYDAMYFAGLIADGSRMTAEQVRAWAGIAYGGGISAYTVPWVATEHPQGFEMALEWIGSDNEKIAITGWMTLSTIMSVRDDASLDLGRLRELVLRVEKEIRSVPPRLCQAMNGFLISAGSFVPPLTAESLAAAAKIGLLKVKIDGTACKIPSAEEYIRKVEKAGRLGRKRSAVKC